jgi:thiol-disulfide isomerase/thioredoxin
MSRASLPGGRVSSAWAAFAWSCAGAALAPLLLALGAAGCSEGDKPLPPPPPKERSNVVVSSAKATGPSSASSPSATASAAPRPPRQLCTGSTEGLKTPHGRIKTAQAAGVDALPMPIAFGAGKWIWVNLWAAWCVPCKEEMPRLLRWQDELRKSGVLLDLAFVSLDDDERQMQRFLDEQPRTGLRATYWLPEELRKGWLQPLGIAETAQLPVQALVSPRGDVACVINGALEEDDFPQLAKIIKGGR